MDTLQGELVGSLGSSRDAEVAIIEALWPAPKNKRFEQYDWKPFSSYYMSQCEHALYDQGQHVSVRKHQHLVDICHGLQDNTPREQLKANLLSALAQTGDKDTEIADNTIDLAARIYFMVNIGGTTATITPGRTQLPWPTGKPSTALADFFKPQQSLSGVYVKFERSFTARTVDCIAGIRIRWTDNLADHLRMMDPDDKTVAIFHHVSFLKRQGQALYPAGLITETMQTLSFLFPQHDKSLQTWLQSQRKGHNIDRELSLCGQLRLDDRQLKNFRFRHDRLVILKQAFDESRPATLSQWWYDRRNGVQWYTFWVAVTVLFLTVFFGMVQSIEGALQVYKAYHPTLV
jgi:hypothetical protein